MDVLSKEQLGKTKWCTRSVQIPERTDAFFKTRSYEQVPKKPLIDVEVLIDGCQGLCGYPSVRNNKCKFTTNEILTALECVFGAIFALLELAERLADHKRNTSRLARD